MRQSNTEPWIGKPRSEKPWGPTRIHLPNPGGVWKLWGAILTGLWAKPLSVRSVAPVSGTYEIDPSLGWWGRPHRIRDGFCLRRAKGVDPVSRGVQTGEKRRRLAIAVSLGGLYFIWGSTYLAIRIAIETLPPFLMAGFRFLLAGAILYGWARARGAERPGWRFWRTAMVSGGFMLACGNGAVVWAEQFVPSGLVSLLVATVPLWIVLQDWGWGRGGAPAAGVLFGILWGFCGVALLVSGAEIGRAGVQDLVGGLLVLGGAGAWAAGSLVSRYGARPRSAALGNGMQMLTGGVLLTSAGLLRGEASLVALDSVSLPSVLAFFYLVVFGSLLGFSSYTWLLRKTTPAVASTYAYVNPVVALLLGWGFAGEPLAGRTVLAAAIILSAVMLITTRRSRGGPPERARG